MTRSRTRIATAVATVTAAVALGAATLGCGIISNVGNAVDNLAAVGDLTDKLTKSADLTFTAGYTMADGSGDVTVVQQPPNAAFRGKDGSFILTGDTLLMCTGPAARTTCQRAPAQTAAADRGAYLTAVAGGGFISTPMAISLLGAASIVPDVDIKESTRTVAGLKSTCLKATGISSAQQARAGNVDMSELTVCVADNGVLTQFTGLGTDGSKVGVELATYGTTVDPTAFAAPKGAKIVDVDQVNA